MGASRLLRPCWHPSPSSPLPLLPTPPPALPPTKPPAAASRPPQATCRLRTARVSSTALPPTPPPGCNLQDELFASFEQVLALADRRGEPYARIVLENSGVAEPHVGRRGGRAGEKGALRWAAAPGAAAAAAAAAPGPRSAWPAFAEAALRGLAPLPHSPTRLPTHTPSPPPHASPLPPATTHSPSATTLRRPRPRATP